MEFQNVLAIAFLVLAYAMLIPGLALTLFTAKAEAFGVTVLDLEKSTMGTVRLLLDSQSYIPALIILVLSVLMPFVKLALLLTIGLVGNQQLPSQTRFRLLKFVHQVSKWATVDVFAAATMAGFFSAQTALQVDLHAGFYCFLAYCILSTAGTLLLDLSDLRPDGNKQALASQPPTSLRLPLAAAMVIVAVAASALAFLLAWPAMLKLEASVFLQEVSFSVGQLVHQLWIGGSRIAAVTLLVFVAGLPMAHVVSAAHTLTGTGEAMPRLKLWLQNLAMLDVFGLSIVVVALASSGVNENLKMSMLPAGWAICAFDVLLLAHSWATQPTSTVTEEEQERFTA